MLRPPSQLRSMLSGTSSCLATTSLELELYHSILPASSSGHSDPDLATDLALSPSNSPELSWSASLT